MLSTRLAGVTGGTAEKTAAEMAYQCPMSANWFLCVATPGNCFRLSLF